MARKYYYDLSVQIWNEDNSGYYFSVIQTHSDRPHSKFTVLAVGEVDTLEEAVAEAQASVNLTLE